MLTSDCNPGIEFSIPGSEIEKLVIPGFHFGIRLTDWSFFNTFNRLILGPTVFRRPRNFEPSRGICFFL